MQFIVRYLWLTVLRSPITIPSFIHFKFDLANRRIIRFQSKQHKQPLRTHSNGRECALRSHRKRKKCKFIRIIIRRWGRNNEHFYVVDFSSFNVYRFGVLFASKVLHAHA